MNKTLDLANWPRKEHFEFFRGFDEPFFGATVIIDCTQAYENAKAAGVSFFFYYLHRTLAAVNAIESFRYRIDGDEIIIHDRIDASPTISREDGSFGFALIEFDPELKRFSEGALAETERIKITPGLFTREFPGNIIHFSALPWIDFTALSHARSYSFKDSCPKISFGKMTVSDEGKKSMPVSVHVHHGLMDGLHVGQFLDCLQQEMNRR